MNQTGESILKTDESTVGLDRLYYTVHHSSNLDTGDACGALFCVFFL